MLPERTPVMVTKSSFIAARATMPPTTSGTTVMRAPSPTQRRPCRDIRTGISFSPAFSPTQARKRAMPNSRSRDFAAFGM